MCSNGSIRFLPLIVCILMFIQRYCLSNSCSLCLCFGFLGTLHIGPILCVLLLTIKVELIIGHLHVLCLRELVPQGGDEFWIYFQRERLHFFNCLLQVALGVSGEFGDALCPSALLLELRAREDHGSSGNLRWTETKQTCIKHCNFLNILSIEENLLVSKHLRKSLVSLQKAVGRWSCEDEAEGGKNFLLHLNDLIPVEFVLADSEEITQVGWIYFFVLG